MNQLTAAIEEASAKQRALRPKHEALLVKRVEQVECIASLESRLATLTAASQDLAAKLHMEEV